MYTLVRCLLRQQFEQKNCDPYFLLRRFLNEVKSVQDKLQFYIFHFKQGRQPAQLRRPAGCILLFTRLSFHFLLFKSNMELLLLSETGLNY